ncbi:MAG: HNH endonuclease [Moorea sp. SIOASIH]|uniref:HNH endonuclease family protein n=1 Tax=Moorena sp. SIOASIH TaxID=2607817 RepID=UPI0013B92289|nr:HNH endonuclease family protein [Moorena sp. SIOASIH]NEO39269.1 HNH endonuclease [Moorena sp. SIOASIH]
MNEILNARGINLSPVDLIKNKVLAECDEQYPIDFAKEKWDEISNRLTQRETNTSLEDYVLHWWMARHKQTRKRNFYKDFRKKLQSRDIVPQDFLEDLHSTSELYIKIASPQTSDWNQADQKPIFYSLLALNTFKIIINRPFLISLFLAKQSKKNTQSFLIYTLTKIEYFHFVFNAICSMRPSSVERLYLNAARHLQESSNKREAIKVIDDLIEDLTNKLPSEATFLDKFRKLKFTNSFTTHKKLIQYIFIKMELHARKNNEFYPEDLTLEHILPQSSGDKTKIGMIGNIIPIGESLNGDAGIRPLSQKMATYKKSDYRIVQEFVEKNGDKSSWEVKDIESRTEQLAREAFQNVWALNQINV